MDYYSGAPEPTDYDYNGNGSYNNGGGFNLGDFFRKNSLFILIGLAVIIAILMIIFLFTGDNNKPEYGKQDDDSYLSKLTVSGGSLEPEFSKELFEYKIYATSDYITFSCETSSKKAKVEGCDEGVLVDDEKVKYNIKVTAEDSNVTRYYFTIIKSDKLDVNDEESEDDSDISINNIIKGGF